VRLHPFVPTLAWLALPIAVSGCTLLVGLDPGAEPALCAADAECRAGWRCDEGTCRETGGALVVGVGCQSIGELEGTVPGPEPWSLVVPDGALPRSLCVDSSTSTSTSTLAEHEVLGPAVLFSADQAVDGEVIVRFTSGTDDAAACAGDCAIFRLDDGTWQALLPPNADGGPPSTGVVEGRTVRLGIFLAARERRASVDAGVVDAGVIDAGSSDAGGPSDAGQPDLPDLFAACDLSATSCAGGLACVPDPFDPTTGLCLATCSAGGAACASCGAVLSLPGQWCRPQALSGAAGAGVACTASADCDAATTNGCVDFGDGVSVCAAGCDPGAANIAAACGGGCCAGGNRAGDDGAYCRDTSLCVATDGAPCLTDGECAGGRCRAAPDGVARCASDCDQSGGCGDGLCCLPSSCDGAGMCVVAEVCAGAVALVCGDVCIDDAACPGVDEFCIDGACTTVSGCGCFTHGQCASDERCDIDGAQQTACTSAGDDPCCGVCAALPSVGACFSDENCPPAGDATAVLCELPAACADDAFGQCEGSCRALATGECVASTDCGGGQVCVDHVCL